MKIDHGRHQAAVMIDRTTTKIVTMAVLVCFMLTSVCGQALQAAADLRGAARGGVSGQAFEDFVVPPSCGRITGGRCYGSRQVVVNIQDLHCHPEVQKNISLILSALDTRSALRNVYVEGGYGDVDTSWLCGLTTQKLKSEVLEKLVAQGALTGAEYYSAVSNRPRLLQGIEDEDTHKANIVRLGKILERKDIVGGHLDAMGRDLEYLEAKYLGSRNKGFNRLVEGYRAGRIPADKYYRALTKYVRMIDAEPGKYPGAVALSLADYPNIGLFIELNRLSRKMNYRELRSQMQRYTAELRSVLPFSEYNELLAKTDNFTKTDELCVYLGRLSRDHAIPLANYPELGRFLAYAEKSRAVNPVSLTEEERRLGEEIRAGLSRDVRELEVSFLADFFAYFRDFMQNDLTAADYGYFEQRFDKFRAIWRAYAFTDRMSGMDDDIRLMQDFYRANCRRNEYFIDHIAELKDAPNVQDRPYTSFADAAGAVRGGAEIIVVVTGGFHSEGLTGLLQQRGISYLTVLPAVTQDPGLSSETYAKRAVAQAALLEKRRPGGPAGAVAPVSLALGLASQMSSKELFELEIQAANRILSAAGTVDRDVLVKEIEKSAGVTAIYDAEIGQITFDNGAIINLKEKDGAVRAAGIKRGGTVSPVVKASLAATLDMLKLQKAVASGDYYTLIKGAMRIAAEHYLFAGDGLIYEIERDPALNTREKIDGIERELLDRFPGFAQTMIAEREKRKLNLARSADRAQWLKALLAVDLVVHAGFLPGKSDVLADMPQMKVTASAKKYARPFMVNIDGNSGSGKSYVAEKIARRTGAVYYSIGKVYRLVAYLAARSGKINPSGGPLDLSATPVADIEAVAAGIDLAKFGYEYVEGDLHYYYDGQDVTEAFYDPELSRNTSIAAKHEAVHRTVTRLIRQHVHALMNSGYSLVMEGSDATREIWTESDAKIFLKTDAQTAARHRAQRYLGTQGLKMDLRRAYFDVLGDAATEIEYENMTDDEIGRKISEALLRSLADNTFEGYEVPAGVIVIEKDDAGDFSVETMFEKAFAAVQDKARQSFALENRRLKGGVRPFSRGDAEKLLGSQAWRTVPVGDTGLTVEVPRKETDIYFSDGMLGALLAESVAALPADIREALKRNGVTLKIAYVPESATEQLFEYGDGYVLVNTAFKKIRKERFPSDARLGEILFETGIAKGLRKQFGEDFQWNSGVFATLARAHNLSDAAVDRFARRLAEYTEEPALSLRPMDDRISTALETGDAADLPVTVCLSDLHGEFDHLVGVLSVALRHHFTPENVFEELDFMADSFRRAGVKVVIVGDIPDRGPQVKKTFKLIRKLVDTGTGEYVTGNHDMLAFMNLLGLHLPFYDNYRGIKKDYVGYCGGKDVKEYQNISQLLATKRRAHAKGVNSIYSWAGKLQEYMDFADKRQKARQDPNNPEQLQPCGVFNELFEKMYGFKLDEKKGKDVLNKPEMDKEEKFFYQKSGKDPLKEKQLAWWKAVMGRNMGVLVYTGTRGVDKMSVTWWEDRLRELDAMLADVKDAGGAVVTPGVLSRYPDQAQDWERIRAAVEKIIAEQKQEMKKRWESGNWEWAVLDAIMYRNYESAEWWALDWVFHKGWGGLKGDGDEKGFLKQVNEKLKATGQDVSYDAASYLGNIRIQEIRKFYMENFRIFAKDEYGNVFIHGFLPADEEGDVCIGRVDENGIVSDRDADGKRIKGLWYKGVHYAGTALFDGFEKISEDVRNFRYGIDNLADIQEALSLVMYIYADATTKIKPGDMKKYRNLKGTGEFAGINGFDLIYRKLGITRMFNGHNPIDKLADLGIGVIEFGQEGSMLAQTDLSFAPYYGHVGGAYVIGPEGMEAVYYKAGSENLGRITLFGADIYLGLVLADMGRAVPGSGLVHRIADLSAYAAEDPSAVQPDAVDAARLYARETRTTWGLWHRKGNSLFFAITIEENIKSFLKTYFGYYAVNAPTSDEVKEILKHLDISFGGVGARDIIAVFKEPQPAAPPETKPASPAFPIAGYRRDAAAPKLPAQTIAHIARSADRYDTMAAFRNTPGIEHVWFSELPEGRSEKCLPAGIRVVIDGRTVKTWVSDGDGSPVYFMDLRAAGIPESAYADALGRGAAQIMRYLAGTDNVPGIAGMRRPAMVVSAAQDREAVRRSFADQGLNKPVFADDGIFAGVAAADIGPLIERVLVKHNAVSMVMAENKILKMDISDIREFIKALGVFNAVGNGQMMVEWDLFAKALAGKTLDEGRIESLLKEAREHGVIVHCAFKPADAGSALQTVKDLYRLGFQGVSLDVTGLDTAGAQALIDALKNYPLTAVTAPAGVAARSRLVRLNLNEAKTARFSPDEVIDLQIPRGLSEEQLRDCMRSLPLANTIIFHSADAASLIGGTRDILDKKLFASLLDSLLNFGVSGIETTEKARRLGYVWNANDLPDLPAGEAGKKQIALLRAGDFAGLSVLKADVSEAIREQAAELATPELKNAFLGALAEKMLVRERLISVDRELGTAYAKGAYSIKSARYEEMLGSALARLLDLPPQEAGAEKAAYAALKTGYQGSASSLLLELSADPGRPGYATAVIELVPPEILMDYSAGRTIDGKPGTLDVNTTRALLGAA